MPLCFGRALKDYGTINSSASLSFGDASSISAVAVPYVDLLNRLGIISGDTDGNFNPKSTINRAEMAVFVSKSYDVVKSGATSSNTNNNSSPVSQAGSITGTITAVTAIGSNTAITVDGGSATMSFTGTSTTPVLSGSTRVVISTLAVGDKVVASYNGQDLVSVLVTSKASSTTTNTNTNKSTSEVSGGYVSMTSSYIKVKVNSTTKTYNYVDDSYDNTTFYIDGSKSTYSKFKDAADTDKTVRLVLDSNGEISKAYLEDTISGTFVSMSSSGIKIKVSSSTKSYDFVDDDYDDVTFRIDGSKSTYSKVKSKAETGDTIKLTLDDDGDVEEVNLVTEDDADVEGTFVSISSGYIKIKKSGSTKTYDFVDDDYDDVTFKIDGSSSTYSKVKSKAETGNTIKLTLNSSDKVTAVNLVTDDDADAEGTFVSINSGYIKIKKSGSTKTYDFIDDDYDDVTFKIDGSSSTYSKVKSKAETGNTIKLTLNSSDKVTAVNLVTDDDADAEGTFVSINSGYIKIKKSGSTKTYDFIDDDYDDVTFKIDGSSSTYSKVKSKAETGNTIKLTLNSSDKVTAVNLITEDEDEVKGTFVSIKEEYIKVKKSGSSSSTKYYFEDKDYSNVTFYYNDSSKKYSYIESNAEEGDTVKLILDGDEVTRVYITEGSSGDVSGQLTYLSSSKIKVSGDSYSFKNSSSCDIDITDGRSTTIDDFDDLKDAYDDDKKIKVEVTLNSNDEVTAISGYVYEVEGDVTSVSTSDDTIKVKTSNATVTYKLGSDVDIDNDGGYRDTISGLKSAYDDNKDDMEVELTLDEDGYVTKVEVSL